MRFYASVFVFLIFISGFFTVSCSKNNVSEKTQEEPEVLETFISGKILSKNAELCLFGRDSEMHPLIKMEAGADIDVLELDGEIDMKTLIAQGDSTGDSSDNNSGDQEKAEISEPGTDYVHVVYDSMDFWLEKSVLAFNCENAVAIEKTFLYSDPELTQKIDSKQNPLKFASRIAKSTERSAENSGENLSVNENPKSAKIFYYDSAEKSVREAFVSSASISTKIDDIVVSQVVESLKTTTRAHPRNELFAKAAKYKPCPKVLAALNEQKVEKQTNSYKEVLKSMQRMTFGVNVDELLTVDQSKDPFK